MFLSRVTKANYKKLSFFVRACSGFILYIFSELFEFSASEVNKPWRSETLRWSLITKRPAPLSTPEKSPPHKLKKANHGNNQNIFQLHVVLFPDSSDKENQPEINVLTHLNVENLPENQTSVTQ